jgi:hypothetical protein
MLGGLMLLASKANEQDKDETRKKKTGALLDLLAASSYDADGNEIPVEERMEKLKDMVGEDNWETFKKDMEETYKDNKDYYYNDIKGREAVIVYRDDLKLYNQVVSKISKWK